MAREAGRHSCHRRSWVKGCRCHCAWQAIDKGAVSCFEMFFRRKDILLDRFEIARLKSKKNTSSHADNNAYLFHWRFAIKGEKGWGGAGRGGGEGIERSGISYFTRVVEIFPIQNSNSSNEFERCFKWIEIEKINSIFKNCWKSNRNIICRKKSWYHWGVDIG